MVESSLPAVSVANLGKFETRVLRPLGSALVYHLAKRKHLATFANRGMFASPFWVVGAVGAWEPPDIFQRDAWLAQLRKRDPMLTQTIFGAKYRMFEYTLGTGMVVFATPRYRDTLNYIYLAQRGAGRSKTPRLSSSDAVVGICVNPESTYVFESAFTNRPDGGRDEWIAAYRDSMISLADYRRAGVTYRLPEVAVTRDIPPGDLIEIIV